MNKFVLLVLIGSLAFVTEGCSFFSKFADSRKELEKETVKPVPVRVNTAQNKVEEGSETEDLFADLEEEEEEEALPKIAGLIPATDPDARVRNSVRGRNDPFSILTLNPRIQIDEEKRASLNESSNRVQTSNRSEPRNTISRRNDNSSADLPLPEEVFEPTLAQDVVVSGLFEAAGRTQIIVQAPEESSSRYVEVGQYLSNGQILVKRIDKNHFPGPMIILEQSGVEVAKIIGFDSEEEDTISSLPKTTPDRSWDSAISLK
ncbi:MAG: hypothetical protein AAFO95_08620 [Cyanobacteria bacterium J06600_6]